MFLTQGIEIVISELTGPADCSSDYLEVGYGSEKSFDQMEFLCLGKPSIVKKKIFCETTS